MVKGKNIEAVVDTSDWHHGIFFEAFFCDAVIATNHRDRRLGRAIVCSSEKCNWQRFRSPVCVFSLCIPRGGLIIDSSSQTIGQRDTLHLLTRQELGTKRSGGDLWRVVCGNTIMNRGDGTGF